MKKLFFIGAVVFGAQANALPGLPLHETWTSVRALGMGNAYSAIVNDGDSLFYNPAGLAKVKGVNWTIFDVHAGLDDPNILQTYKDFQAAGTNTASFIESQYGKNYYANVGVKSIFYVPDFAAGVYGNGEALFSISNPPYPQLNLEYYLDYGGVVGFGFDVVPGFVKVGFDTKYILRTGAETTYTADQLATLDKSTITNGLNNDGKGYALDTGLVITVPGPIKPSLSFVWKNMGVTTFTPTDTTTAPPRILDEMVIGGALEIDVPLLSITPVIDYKYANRADIQFGNKLSVGVEIGLPLLDLRAGFNQGYYTLGAGLDLAILKVDVATYGQELGQYPGQIEDRRYVAQVTFDVGFDPGSWFGSDRKSGPGGSAGDGGGSYRRGLKQRR